MHFLFSGEGPTDLGVVESGLTTWQSSLPSSNIEFGPMALIADRIVEQKFQYSILEVGSVGIVSKQDLIASGSEFKTSRKSLSVPGKKRAKETRYFFNNARSLARLALKKQSQLNVDVIAVLFRDADGTASADRGQWELKWSSMLDGFQEEKFERGVPMIPKPKSEAWLLCALKRNPYQNCSALEDRSGNDDSPNSLKQELRSVLECDLTRQQLCQLIENRSVDIDRIDMPSFLAFRNRLEYVITAS